MSQNEAMFSRPVAVEHVVDDIAQMVVVRLADPAPRGLLGGRGGRRDDQAVFFFVFHGREIGALPGADRTAAVQAQEEDELLASSEGRPDRRDRTCGRSFRPRR